MEFETKKVNGSVVYVRKNKKVIPQREDLPGENNPTNLGNIMKFLSELHNCTHNCSTCSSKCGE